MTAVTFYLSTRYTSESKSTSSDITSLLEPEALSRNLKNVQTSAVAMEAAVMAKRAASFAFVSRDFKESTVPLLYLRIRFPSPNYDSPKEDLQLQ
mmetsp:Transcript_11932/g.18705  ORF Transcript_11932/g.18705 Transcript_11932/m.18705 type:complete len:95 (+) Transcript_11932:332-616(+)